MLVGSGKTELMPEFAPMLHRPVDGKRTPEQAVCFLQPPGLEGGADSGGADRPAPVEHCADLPHCHPVGVSSPASSAAPAQAPFPKR